jgi:hypothetical protein
MRQTMRNRRRNLESLAREVPKGISSLEDVLKVAQLLWEQIDTPVSLKLSILARHGQLVDALGVDFEPHRYLEFDWQTARDDYQAISFLRKFPFEVAGIDRRSAALKKFWEAEQLCRTTNIRIRTGRVRGFPPRVERVLFYARRKIAHWLGDLDARSWALRCRFGPGVDAFNTGERVSPYHKLSRPSVTPDFRDGALALVRSHPVWERILAGFHHDTLYGEIDERCTIRDMRKLVSEKITVLPGNRVTFVPKTALIDRSIAIEPGLNIFAQLGLGALIRGRLKRVGLDLNDQRPNQVLAREGSISGTVTTIDLSSASDTVATELVRELLPDQWFSALDWCRSKRGSVGQDGAEPVSFWYEKFSSMGNGFTFELESMIFYALALSCAEDIGVSPEKIGKVRAYGDDITIPSECVSSLEEVLSYCGFIVNPRKSYSTGVFRESCGADFFNGLNVRPFFFKEFCRDASSLYRLANGIRRVAYRRNFGYGCDRQLHPVWLHVVSRIPNSLRDLRVPFRPVDVPWADVESGDGGLASNLDEALSSPYVRFNTDYMAGWLFAQLQARPSTKRASAEHWDNFYLFALYAGRDGSASDSTTYDQVVGRGESGRRLKCGVTTPHWHDLGPWQGL